MKDNGHKYIDFMISQFDESRFGVSWHGVKRDSDGRLLHFTQFEEVYDPRHITALLSQVFGYFPGVYPDIEFDRNDKVNPELKEKIKKFGHDYHTRLNKAKGGW